MNGINNMEAASKEAALFSKHQNLADTTKIEVSCLDISTSSLNKSVIADIKSSLKQLFSRKTSKAKVESDNRHNNSLNNILPADLIQELNSRNNYR